MYHTQPMYQSINEGAHKIFATFDDLGYNMWYDYYWVHVHNYQMKVMWETEIFI